VLKVKKNYLHKVEISHIKLEKSTCIAILTITIPYNNVYHFSVWQLDYSDRDKQKPRTRRYGKTATDNMGYIPENEGYFLQQTFMCNQIMIIMYNDYTMLFNRFNLFTQLRTVAISFITCLTAWKNSAPIVHIFIKFDIWAVFLNLSQKFKFH
jgi:hypothetical protein